MSIKDKLDIVLITYNRKDSLEKTFSQIFAEKSPIKDFDITVLNNNSTDGTDELINEYCSKYPNLKHIKNRYNIGGCSNIVKAFVEIPRKDYVWVLCDNDCYDWTAWNEVESGINNNVETIITRNCKNKPSDIFYASSLVSACIHKRTNITETVIENMYDGIKILFPHLAIIAKCINEKFAIKIVSKDIVYAGINPDHNSTFVRGVVKEDLPPARRNIYWSVGYFSSVELIKDRKTQIEIIEGTRHFHKSLFDIFKSTMVKNKVFYNNYFYNFYQIYRVLDFSQKIRFITAFIVINLSCKDYSFYEMRSKDDWKSYFEKINEQKYIDSLSKKLKGKRVLLYGAGMTAEVLLNNFDVSKINIVGISDKRFERTDEKEFLNIKAIKPNDIKNLDYDIILFTLKLYTNAQKSLKKSGINKKMLTLIKKDLKYALRV